MDNTISTYEQERRQKARKLRDLGLDPFGGRSPGVQPLAAIKSLYKTEMGHDGGPVVKAAGRVMLKRDMGKLTFATLRDDSGDHQIALDKKRLDELAWKVRDLIDLGDLILVEGPLGVTNKGEITIWATKVEMASKALLPPPAKWEGLSDVELRYRQRYVDLWANPQVMQTLKLRMRIVDEVRKFMADRGFLEVETPMMQSLAGGAAARPFKTHHNALDIPLFLRIAPELYLKRLLVGGLPKVFELNRNFRNEGISPRHNPEFTMLEAYEAFGNWETMAELVESMICHVAQTVLGTLKIEHKNIEGQVTKTINLEGDTSKPAGQRWPRIRMVDLVAERTGWRFNQNRRLQDDYPGYITFLTENAAYPSYVRQLPAGTSQYRDGRTDESWQQYLLTRAEGEVKQTVNHFLKLSPAEQLVDVYERWIERTLIDPCFITHVPSVVIPLARENKDDPFFADVYELAINGQELSPGYTELNDPDKQAEHFRHQVGDEEEKQKFDDDFINALKHGMPPAGGMGLGIDRMVMMLTGAESIRDVIFFPLMKPIEQET
jgi:lysyl-tRNA synthetase class 2